VKDFLRYDQMVESAMRGVVREALARTAANGLPGAHHFYITFKTRAPGVILAPHLAERYPDEMTIVLEHQFWDLVVNETEFAVTLSFNNRPERLTLPFDSVTTFADPSVKFGLQFQVAQPAEAEEKLEAKPAAVPGVKPRAARAGDKATLRAVEKPADKQGEVVTLDSFRKK